MGKIRSWQRRDRTSGRRHESPGWGSAAVATSGGLTVEVDESLSGPERWQVVFEAPHLYLILTLRTAQQLKEIRDFLGGMCPGAEELKLATVGRSVSFLRDDEFTDRVFVRIAAPGHSVRLTLTAAETGHIIAALSDVVEQLVD